MSTPEPHDASVIQVKRWATERPLLYLNVIAGVSLWVVFIAASPQMLGWSAFLVAIFALMHLGFIARVRGSAVRLGPDQLPELYARVENLSGRMGLKRTPEIYLMQQDGAINAFATRFLRSHIVVLLSDLLEACGENTAARDMIIGHELGHIRAGHLRGQWLLFPASFIPFLGAALSRAREYTCDRYGREAAGDVDGALLGLTILAAGGRYAPQVNRAALARQRVEMRSGWMTLGEWLGSHPPLSKRLAALSPDLAVELSVGASRWLRPVLAVGLVMVIGVISLSMWMPSVRSRTAERPPVDAAAANVQVRKDLAELTALIDADLRAGRHLPWDLDALYERWTEARPASAQPLDPFNGYWYDYDQRGDAYRLWSAGPDGRSRTQDDIVHDSRVAPANSGL